MVIPSGESGTGSNANQVDKRMQSIENMFSDLHWLSVGQYSIVFGQPRFDAADTFCNNASAEEVLAGWHHMFQTCTAMHLNSYLIVETLQPR